VPFPLSVKEIPAGTPVALSEGVGVPDVVTVNEPWMPAVKVVPAALLKEGGVPVTVSEEVLELDLKFVSPP
jgi:hypothetical protein